MAESSSTLVFFVNGRKIEDGSVCPEWTLLRYLRDRLHLTGSKLGCGEGGCGACTVMLSYVDEADGAVRHVAANACLAPVASLHGMAVTTIEGIGSTKTRMHPIQESLAKSHGSQCGFCTPGFVMSMYTLLRNKPRPDMDDVEVYLQGNLCRCTGYRPILDGFRPFTEEGGFTGVNGCASAVANGCCGGNAAGGGGCCRDKSNGVTNGSDVHNGSQENGSEEGSGKHLFSPCDPSQEFIFPPELRLRHAELSAQPLAFESGLMKWIRPTDLDGLLKAKKQYPNAKIVVGATELSVEMYVSKVPYPVMIHPVQIPELNVIEETSDGLVFGAAVTLSHMEEACRATVASRPAEHTSVLREVLVMLNRFAGRQIRDVAAAGGNICTGSPISDLNPIFLAAGTTLVLASADGGRRTVTMDHTFFTGYRRSVMRPDEVLVSFTLPFTKQGEHFAAYKQSRRRDDDIAIVNAAFFFRLGDDGAVGEVRMGFGGMAPTPILATKTMAAMKGLKWSEETFERMSDCLLDELTLAPDTPGGMVKYRMAMALSFFFKAYLSVSEESGRCPAPQRLQGASAALHPERAESFQLADISPEGVDVRPVGKSLVHKSAHLQATGEALYIDDMPRFENELYIGFVTSTEAHADILGIETEAALAVEGVLEVITAKDIPEECSRYKVPILKDEVLLAIDRVDTVGQIVAVVVACDKATAQRAAKQVRVRYRPLPAVITIDEAIAAGSFIPWANSSMECGDAAKALAGDCDHVLEGEIRMAAQEHFYLETQVSLAVPGNESGEMTVYASTQNPTETQELVAHALGVPMNKVVCRVKRIGGGFGGKETRSVGISMLCAIAAQRHGRAVRVMLDRNEDMVMSGHRHPFMGRYKVGFMKDGTINALRMELYYNAGHTMDLSFSVMERGLLHADNAYRIENLHVTGHLCKTNLPSNTAFRGFGAPQALLSVEDCVERVADFLGMNPNAVRRVNLYKTGDKIHFGQVLEDCHIERCLDECLAQSGFDRVQREIESFNAAHRYRKRGLAATPVRFGISFVAKHMNQAGSLVQIYRDGSVLVTHSGVEIGQGLHTKMIQVASQALGVPHERIHLMETATDKVPNTSPTAASVGSDLNGMALMIACKTLRERLDKLWEQHPDDTWDKLVMRAHFDRVNLSATGFYATPGLGYDFKTREGRMFDYFAYGVGVSSVEIDCLTGDHTVLRTDIVMDVGESLNPAIDVGQIEGAFMQGYGLFVMEQMMHTPSGRIVTQGPGAYKIPSAGDIPASLNVSLLRGSSNPRAVYSSKAVGEPPLFLAASVFFAIRRAIIAARKETAASPAEVLSFQLDSPSTCERIRMACNDVITDKVGKAAESRPEFAGKKPWSIQV